jgi:NAD(P)H dehydrogenase (quinone)
MSSTHPILVTGAAGNIGGIGRNVVELLRKRDLPVRAFVRGNDERSDALKEMGADVFVGDLTSGADVARSLEGCRRMYFGMSVSPPYLEATVIAAAAAREIADFEILVNISQMTVSQMDLRNTTESPQQKQHWLAEQALNWSGLPVVHIRSTVFLEHFFFSDWAAQSIAKNGTIRLPFGSAKTSPVSAYDVARVVATILENPKGHAGKVYELTGPSSQDMNAIAREYQEALGRNVKYVDVPFDEWTPEFESHGLPSHVAHHLFTMAKLHADNRYDRFTNDVEKVTGIPSMSIRDYVKSHPELFAAVAPTCS